MEKQTALNRSQLFYRFKPETDLLVTRNTTGGFVVFDVYNWLSAGIFLVLQRSLLSTEKYVLKVWVREISKIWLKASAK